MLLYFQLIAVALLGVVNLYFGVAREFYVTIWWWDIPAHFIGGVWAGFLGAWFIIHWKRRLSIFECAMFALFVGILWEIFEYVNGVGGSAGPFMGYWLDTIKDLIMDTLGGALAGYIARNERI